MVLEMKITKQEIEFEECLKQRLEQANTQTKTLDNTSNDVNKILDDLKPTLMNKNNMVISSEDIHKIKNYTDLLMMRMKLQIILLEK